MFDILQAVTVVVGDSLLEEVATLTGVCTSVAWYDDDYSLPLSAALSFRRSSCLMLNMFYHSISCALCASRHARSFVSYLNLSSRNRLCEKRDSLYRRINIVNI